MSIETYRPKPKQQKVVDTGKSDGLLGAIGGLLGGAAGFLGGGPAGAAAGFGIGKSIGGSVGGLSDAVLGEGKKVVEDRPKALALSPSGDSLSRRLESINSNPTAQLQQSAAALKQAPPDVQQTYGPAILEALKRSQQGVV